MRSAESLKLLEIGVLKKGCKVKMNGLKGFDTFTEIDDAFIKKARPGELEDDWVVVVINGQTYDSAWISEVEETINMTCSECKNNSITNPNLKFITCHDCCFGKTCFECDECRECDGYVIKFEKKEG